MASQMSLRIKRGRRHFRWRRGGYSCRRLCSHCSGELMDLGMGSVYLLSCTAVWFECEDIWPRTSLQVERTSCACHCFSMADVQVRGMN